MQQDVKIILVIITKYDVHETMMLNNKQAE